MNEVLIRAVIVVTVAMVCYAIGVFVEQRKEIVTKTTRTFLTAGVVLDISSTALMIAGSGNIPITAHGMLGYSALFVMLIDTTLIWRHWIKHNITKVPRRLHIYTRVAFCWWVIAYIAGAIISSTLG